MLGDSATILKVEVDKNPAAANAYNIKGVPTLILFKAAKPSGGSPVWCRPTYSNR